MSSSPTNNSDFGSGDEEYDSKKYSEDQVVESRRGVQSS